MTTQAQIETKKSRRNWDILLRTEEELRQKIEREKLEEIDISVPLEPSLPAPAEQAS